MPSLSVRLVLPMTTLAFGLFTVACGGDDGSDTGGAGGSDTGGSSGGGAGGSAQTGGAGGAQTGGSGGSAQTGGSGGAGGGFDAGTAADRNRVQPGQVCERLATVQCAGEQYCCDNPGRTFDQCKQAQLQECASVYLDQVSQNPITAYSVDAAEDAFTEFEQLASECDPTIASWGISPDGLRGITLGTVAANGACTPANPTDLPAVAAHLASCQNPATHACLPTGVPPLAPWTCAARSQLDGPCFTDLNCIEGLYCNNNLDSPVLTGSQCKQRKANGSPCSFPNECVSLTCEGGSCVEATAQTAYCLGN